MISSLKDAEFAASVTNLLSQTKGVGRNHFNDLVRNRVRLEQFITENAEQFVLVFGKVGDSACDELNQEIGKVKSLEVSIEKSGVTELTVEGIEKNI